MKQFEQNVMWDLTITDIISTNSQYLPLELQGLITHCTKFEGTVPDAVSGKYTRGASVQNILTGVWYRNEGTTASPVFTVWAI